MRPGEQSHRVPGYNSRLELTSVQAGGWLTLGYDYGVGNNNGNVKSHSISDVGANQTFIYDAMNRLQWASATAAVPSIALRR
ncbi:MAG: hypothetical protein ACR2NN_25205 [Bryobacteraceae bacterium]